MMFGAISMGNASAYGPDIGKAYEGALKIFTLTETPNEIDAMDESAGKV